VSFFITVASESPGSIAVPQGTVIIDVDGQPKGTLRLSGGKSVLSKIKLPVGSHSVTVYYTPVSADFAPAQGRLIGGERFNK
jgi:hypothetical protein